MSSRYYRAALAAAEARDKMKAQEVLEAEVLSELKSSLTNDVSMRKVVENHFKIGAYRLKKKYGKTALQTVVDFIWDVACGDKTCTQAQYNAIVYVIERIGGRGEIAKEAKELAAEAADKTVVLTPWAPPIIKGELDVPRTEESDTHGRGDGDSSCCTTTSATGVDSSERS